MADRKVLVISTSLRAGSNSEVLADAVLKGVIESGDEGELISLKEKTINFCKGCLACQKIHKCVMKDDMAEIVEKVKEAEILVFVTPIYYYGMSGPMKTLLDRLNPLYGSDYNFRDVYLLTVAADESSNTPDRAVEGLEGWLECFENAHLKDTMFFGGINDANFVKGKKDMIDLAYSLGWNIS
ncbi:MAG: flavodoxin family protein [Clostridia bacterium]|nr:flavodoxin family protein [Clostridia bacterium]